MKINRLICYDSFYPARCDKSSREMKMENDRIENHADKTQKVRYTRAKMGYVAMAAYSLTHLFVVGNFIVVKL